MTALIPVRAAVTGFVLDESKPCRPSRHQAGSWRGLPRVGEPYCFHDDREHGRITALPGAENHFQRAAFPVAGAVDLGTQPATGAAYPQQMAATAARIKPLLAARSGTSTLPAVPPNHFLRRVFFIECSYTVQRTQAASSL